MLEVRFPLSCCPLKNKRFEQKVGGASVLRASFGISTLSSHHIEPRVEEKLSEIEWIEQPEA